MGSGDPTSYGYDKANNLTSIGDAIEYAHNSSNELEEEETGGSLSIEFYHDERGNVVEMDRAAPGRDQEFGFDRLNRLVAYSDPEESWRYRYDALGRRVKKFALDGGETHWYFYDGERVILELVDDGEETFVRGEYVYGVGLDEVILEWLDDGGTEEPFWPMVDSLGTVRDLGEPYGGGAQVRMAYRYSPWGEVLEEAAVGGDAVYQDVLFTARWLDRETRNADSPGLYHYRAREYAPELGRFLERDPIGVWGDGIGLGNGYAYVGNDGVNAVDPSGLEISAAGAFCHPYGDYEKVATLIDVNWDVD